MKYFEAVYTIQKWLNFTLCSNDNVLDNQINSFSSYFLQSVSGNVYWYSRYFIRPSLSTHSCNGPPTEDFIWSVHRTVTYTEEFIRNYFHDTTGIPLQRHISKSLCFSSQFYGAVTSLQRIEIWRKLVFGPAVFCEYFLQLIDCSSRCHHTTFYFIYASTSICSFCGDQCGPRSSL